MDLCDYIVTRTQSGSCYLDTLTFLNPDCILTVLSFKTATVSYHYLDCLPVCELLCCCQVSSLLPWQRTDVKKKTDRLSWSWMLCSSKKHCFTRCIYSTYLFKDKALKHSGFAIITSCQSVVLAKQNYHRITWSHDGLNIWSSVQNLGVGPVTCFTFFLKDVFSPRLHWFDLVFKKKY